MNDLSLPIASIASVMLVCGGIGWKIVAELRAIDEKMGAMRVQIAELSTALRAHIESERG